MIVGNTFRDIPSPVRGCHGRDRMIVHLKLPMQSVHITTKIVRLNATLCPPSLNSNTVNV